MVYSNVDFIIIKHGIIAFTYPRNNTRALLRHKRFNFFRVT